MFSGFPDRMFLGPDRRVAFVEFKTEIGTVKKNQDKAHDTLRRLGWTVAVIRTKQQFIEFLDEWLR